MKDFSKLVLTLTAVCVICGAVVSTAYMVTKEPIRIANEAKKRASILDVMPEGSGDPVTKTNLAGRIYWESDKGYAMEISSNSGYAGRIDLMLGFTKDGRFNKYSVLSHSETPTLGSHITDTFVAHVTNRPAASTDWRVTKDGGEIVPISSATISSRAVCGAIAEGCAVYSDILEGK